MRFERFHRLAELNCKVRRRYPLDCYYLRQRTCLDLELMTPLTLDPPLVDRRHRIFVNPTCLGPLVEILRSRQIVLEQEAITKNSICRGPFDGLPKDGDLPVGACEATHSRRRQQDLGA